MSKKEKQEILEEQEIEREAAEEETAEELETEKYRITILMNGEGDTEQLSNSVQSLVEQKNGFWEKIQLLVFLKERKNQNEYDEQKVYLQNMEAEEDHIQIVEYKDSIWKEYDTAIENIEAPYLMFMKAGDTVKPNTIIDACSSMRVFGEATDLAMMNCSYQGKKPEMGIGKLKGAEGATYNRYVRTLDTLDELGMIPDYWEAVIWKTEAAKEEKFDERHGFEIMEERMYRILDKKRTIGLLRNAIYSCASVSRRSTRGYENNLKAEYYLGALDAHWTLITEYYENKYHEIPLFVQCHLLYELINRLNVNKNQSNQHALNDAQLEEFWGLCKKWLQDIDDKLMIANVRVAKMPRHPYALQYLLLNLKYDNSPEMEYFIPDMRSVRKNMLAEVFLGKRGKKAIKRDPHYKYPVRIKVKGREMPYALQPRPVIDLVNYEDGYLIIDCSCPEYLREGNVRWSILLNNEPIPYTDTVRYKATKFFGIETYHAYTFQIRINTAELDKKNELRFALYSGDVRIIMPIYTGRFTSRISASLDNSYWCFGDYLMMFNVGKIKDKIHIRRRTPWMHLKREVKFLLEICSGRTRKPKMLKSRLQYWLTYPRYHRKNIWITFDKIYKGGDCGEYFYKYCVSRKDTDVVPIYLMNEDAPDMERLRKEGYKPTVYGTQKHRNLYLHAKMIFATHAGLYNFNGIAEDEIPYLQDLLIANAACIQHGLTVQDLAFNANRAFNNNKRYYCASKYEVRNLLQPRYGYDDPSVIRLTGIPRYDGLVNNDQKQILITPTWRSYIALPPDSKNNARPYSSVFKRTDYYAIYNNLISDKKLVETARKTGYKLIYLIHPAIAMQIEDFDVHEGVEIISALDVNYEKILTESSLMLTDYSGVQFDFAYMRKPVVYYHPAKLPPHYVEGGFFYDTQGFGEICTEHQELVDTLCAYMESGCALKQFYKERQDDFFAFSDHENCKRIFEDAYKWQKELPV